MRALPRLLGAVLIVIGAGESSFGTAQTGQPERRFGVQMAMGHRLNFVGRIGVAAAGEQDVPLAN